VAAGVARLWLDIAHDACFVGSISGFTTNVASWSLDVIEKKTGTFKITGSLVNEPMVSLFPNPKNFHLSFPQGIQWRFPPQAAPSPSALRAAP
jgi:hypothetical protein